MNSFSKSFTRLTKFALVVVLCSLASAANVNTLSGSATGSSLILLLKNSTDSTYFYAELGKTVSDLRSMAQLQSDTPEQYTVTGDGVTGSLNEASIQSLNGYTNSNLAAYLAGNTGDNITWTIMGSKSAPQATAGAAAFVVTSNVNFMDTENLTGVWENQVTWTAANFFGNNFITDEINRGVWTNGQSTSNGWGSGTPNGTGAPQSFNGAGFENGAALGTAQSMYLLATTGADLANTYKSATTLTLGTNGVLTTNPAPVVTYTVSGTVSGLGAGKSVVLQNNSTNNQTVTNPASTFSFTAQNNGSGYSVAVLTDPAGQSCLVSNGSGTLAGANVTNVVVTCTDLTYSVSGSISGLTASGLSLSLSGSKSDSVSLASGAASYAFTQTVVNGNSYTVTISAQPTGQTCTLSPSPATGTVGTTNIVVNVTCILTTYTISGTNANGASVSISGSSIGGQIGTTANPYSFTAKSGDTVTLTATKTGYTCSVASSPIPVFAADVINANVSCTPITYTISGTTDGATVTASGSTVSNTVTPGISTYSLSAKYGDVVALTPTKLGYSGCVIVGSPIAVSGDTTANVSGCLINTYTISGTVSGLGSGKTLLLGQGTESKTITSNGGFSFATKVNYGAAYGVTVKTQPNGQTCLLTNASSNNVVADVTTISVICSDNAINVMSNAATGSSLILLLKNSTDSTYFYAELGKTVSDLRSMAQLQSDTPEQYTVTGDGVTGPLNEANLQALNGYTNSNLAAYLAGNTGDAITWTIMGSKSAPSATAGAAAFVVTSNVNFMDTENLTGVWENQVTWTAANFFGNNFITDELNNGSWTNGQSTSNGWGSSTPNGTGAPQSFNGAGFENGAALGTAQSMYLLATTGGDLANVYKSAVILTLGTDGILSVTRREYTVSGTVSGLGTGKSVVLQNNGANNQTVTYPATGFSFPAQADGSGYNVTVLTQPVGQACSLLNNSGTLAGANVSNVTVTCTTNTYALTVTSSGGTVTSSPAGISCGATCTASYSYGTSVTLTATPNTGATFSGWAGCDSTSGNTCTVSVTSAKSVTASFTYPVTVSKTGTGSGTVTSTPAGISCGVTCTASYSNDTSVVLTASPAAGSTFSSWSGCDSVSGSSCTVSANAVRSVTASFTLSTYTVSGTVSGLGTGKSVVLQNNGANNQTVTYPATGFSFPAQADGLGYNVTVLTQPVGQTCLVSNATGTLAGANVTNVAVTCTDLTYTVSGSISGLTASGLSLSLSGSKSDSVSLASGAASYAFTQTVVNGNSYTVTISAQPTGQTCTLSPSPATGTVGTNNIVVNVTCAVNTYTITVTNTPAASVSISGSTATNATNPNSATSFSFIAKHGDAVVLSATKTGNTCNVATIPASINPITSNATATVSCTLNMYSVGGTNADGASVAITNSSVTGQVATTANPYSFNAKYGDVVTLSATKTGYSCSVAGSPITVAAANVTTANVTCSKNTYTISGTTDGTTVTASGSTVSNTVTANAGSYSLSAKYGDVVTLSASKTGYSSCVIAASPITVSGDTAANVSGCTLNTYTITVTNTPAASVSISGSSATNATNPNSATSFSFSAKHGDNVTLSATKTGNTCSVTPSTISAIGANAAATVNCTLNTYSVGGNVSGLANGKSIVLSLKSNNLMLSRLVHASNGAFLFTKSVLSGNNYLVNIDIQPSGQVCSVFNTSGIGINSNVSNIGITCQAAYSISGAISGLSTSGMVLRLNNSISLPVAKGATSFKFGSGLINGSLYSLSIANQPSGKTCTIANGVGVVGSGNVTSVSVSCH